MDNSFSECRIISEQMRGMDMETGQLFKYVGM